VKSEVQPSPLCTNDTPRLTIRSFVDSGILSQWRHAAAGVATEADGSTSTAVKYSPQRATIVCDVNNSVRRRCGELAAAITFWGHRDAAYYVNLFQFRAA